MNLQLPELDEPRTESLSELTIVGLAKHFTSETRSDIPMLWQRFVKWIGHVPYQSGPETYGVIRNNNKGRGFYYLAGVAVSSDTAVPDDLTSVHLPPSHYVVFTHRGPVSQLFLSMCAIYTNWVPTAQIELLDAPCFELYGEDFNPQTGLGRIEIWLPVADPASQPEAASQSP